MPYNTFFPLHCMWTWTILFIWKWVLLIRNFSSWDIDLKFYARAFIFLTFFPNKTVKWPTLFKCICRSTLLHLYMWTLLSLLCVDLFPHQRHHKCAQVKVDPCRFVFTRLSAHNMAIHGIDVFMIFWFVFVFVLNALR